jgi:hypothetical protein
MDYCKENEEAFRALMETEEWEYNDHAPGEVVNSIGEVMIQHVGDEDDGMHFALVPTLIRMVEHVHDFNTVDDVPFDGVLKDKQLWSYRLDCGRYGETHEELDAIEYYDRVAKLTYFTVEEGNGWNIRAQRLYNYMVAEMVSLYLRLAVVVDDVICWGDGNYDADELDKACQIFADWKEELGIP